MKNACTWSFSGPNAGIYGPENLRMRKPFKQLQDPEYASIGEVLVCGTLNRLSTMLVELQILSDIPIQHVMCFGKFYR